MESNANPMVADDEMRRSSNSKSHGRTMFVSTNVGTHLVISTDPSDIVADLRGKVRNGHLFCFPHFGEINIGSLMVKHESLFYHLPDSIFVEDIFHGLNGTRYLSVEISGSDLCNEKAIPRPNIGNGSLLKKCRSSQLELNEKALSNRQCTDLVAVTEKQDMIHEEIAKDLKTLGTGDKCLDLSGNTKSKKNRKLVHGQNEDLSVHVLSQNNKKNGRKQTTKEVDNIVEYSSGQVLEKTKRDKNFLQGYGSRQEKVNILNSTKDDNFKDVTVTTNNSRGCKNPLTDIQDISTVVDVENVQGREWITGRNHGMNSKSFCEEDSLNVATKNSGGLQGKADDARDCDIENKLKRKRKQSSQDVVDENKKISTKDVNDVPQISENDNLQGNKYVRTEQTPAKEFGTEKQLNRRRKKSSKKVLDCDEGGFAEDANCKPEMTKHKNCLEYECRKRGDICSDKVVPGKNAQTKDTNGAPVRYLDVVSHTEFNQQCNKTGKRKSKRSTNDSSSVDGQEKITAKKGRNNDTLVNSMKENGHERITDTGNKKKRDISNESGVKNVNMECSEKDVAKHLEEPAMLVNTPVTNNAYHNDAKVKSPKNTLLKNNQDRTVNIEKRRKDEKLEGQGASIVWDKNAQTESNQHCDMMPKRKMKHSSTSLSRDDGQERFIAEEVLENDSKVNCDKGEGFESTSADDNEKRRDIPIENGRVTNLNVQHSIISATRGLECSVEKVGTTYLMSNENCIDKKVKSSNRLSKTSQKRTTDVEQIEVDEVVAKAVTYMQNVRDDKKKLKERLKLKSSTALNGYTVIPPNVPQGNNAVVEKHHSVEKNLAKSTEAYADVGCKSKQTRTALTNYGFDTITTNLSGEKKNTCNGEHKSQFSAENDAETLKEMEKFDTSDHFYSRKSLEELEDDATCSGKLQLGNKHIALKGNIDSCAHYLKKEENSSDVDITQLTEQKQNGDTQGQITVVANNVCGDRKSAIDKSMIDYTSKKLQLVGKTNDGLMNMRKSKKAINHQKDKKSNKPTYDKYSKKNGISLFRSDSDESTDGENLNYSHTMSSLSKRITGDYSDSYDSDAVGTERISKSQSIRTQGDSEPSRSGALLSTAVGKAEDNGGSGSMHPRFVHLLSKKTSLGELFKIARSRRKSESEQFGDRFIIDESPSVDMVLETQDSQCDPIVNSHNNTILPAFPIISNQT